MFQNSIFVYEEFKEYCDSGQNASILGKSYVILSISSLTKYVDFTVYFFVRV